MANEEAEKRAISTSKVFVNAPQSINTEAAAAEPQRIGRTEKPSDRHYQSSCYIYSLVDEF